MKFKKLAVRGLLAIVVMFAGLGIYAAYLTSIGVDPVIKPERQMSKIWSGFPFESLYVEVLGSKMHYIDEGPDDGEVFLLLHGNPTSSYLWRKVVPEIAKSGARVIAVDNIGFGASDRPDIGYQFVDHAEYFQKFIETLDLKNVILVVHDWGSALGFDYAFRNQGNVAGLVFMEAMLAVPDVDNLNPLARRMMTVLRTPGVGEFLVMDRNLGINRVLPARVVRELSLDEMRAYNEPFPTVGSRRPILVWPREIPTGEDKQNQVAQRIADYAAWLPKSELPKLLLCFDPGAAMSIERCDRIADEAWNNLRVIKLGSGLHFVQEDQGAAIGNAIVAEFKSR